MFGERVRGVPISTDPPGAAVIYRGERIASTPCSVAIDRRDTTLVLRKDGFHDQHVDVGTEGNDWVWANIVLGGVPGLLFDAITGSLVVVDDDPVNLQLRPVSASAAVEWKRYRSPRSGRVGQVRP